MELNRKSKLHRELKEHLHRSRMSANAVTLFVWLLLSAQSGCVEAGYDDLRCALGWSYSMVRRTLDELISKGYISVAPATNQHKVTVIRILKLDVVEYDSAVLTDGQGNSSNNSAVLSAVSISEQSKPSNQRNAAALSTDEQGGEQSNSQATVGMLADEQGKTLATVPDIPPGVNDDHQEPVLQKRQPFEIPAKCLFTDELSPIARQALEFIGFECDRRFLSRGFVTILEKYGARRPWPRPGILASHIIERCLHWQGKRKVETKDPRLYSFPPGFQKWRDLLRRQERLEGKAQRQAKAAA